MKCLYYPAPTLDSTLHISDDLHAVGVKDFFLHVICKDEAGLKIRNVHSGNYLETLDVVRDVCIGSAIGFIAGLIGVGLLKYFEPFGPHVPGIVYFATVAAATLFGVWEGGLTGIATENKKLDKFHDDIEAGRYLILIYAAGAGGDCQRDDASQTPGSRTRRNRPAFHQSIWGREAQSGISPPGSCWILAEELGDGAGSCIGLIGGWNAAIPLPQPVVVYADRIQLEDDG
jgi:hypothetical protein